MHRCCSKVDVCIELKASLFLGLHVREGDARLANAAEIVIVELVQRGGFLDADLTFGFEVGTEIFKCVKVLRHSVHEWFEARVGLGASSVEDRNEDTLAKESEQE